MSQFFLLVFLCGSLANPDCASSRESDPCTLPQSPQAFDEYFTIVSTKDAFSDVKANPAGYRVTWSSEDGDGSSSLPSSLQESGVEIAPISFEERSTNSSWSIDTFLGVQAWTVSQQVHNDRETLTLAVNQTHDGRSCDDAASSASCSRLSVAHTYLYPSTACAADAAAAFTPTSNDTSSDGLPPAPCQSLSLDPLLVTTVTLAHHPNPNASVRMVVRLRVRDVEPFWRDNVTVSTALGETRLWHAPRARCANGDWVAVAVEAPVRPDHAESVEWSLTTVGPVVGPCTFYYASSNVRGEPSAAQPAVAHPSWLRLLLLALVAAAAGGAPTLTC